MFLAVRPMVRLVRPWYPWSKTTTAVRLVYTRAIFTAFSTASAPELKSAVRFSWSPGVSSLSCSATSTYPSYGVTMKQVCVKAASCSVALATTASALLPTLVTAMPDPKSISELPSTSSSTPPLARDTYTGRVVPTPAATAPSLRACSSCDFGPGIAVTRRRSCGSGVAALMVFSRLLGSVFAGYGRRERAGMRHSVPLGRPTCPERPASRRPLPAGPAPLH